MGEKKKTKNNSGWRDGSEVKRIDGSFRQSMSQDLETTWWLTTSCHSRVSILCPFWSSLATRQRHGAQTYTHPTISIQIKQQQKKNHNQKRYPEEKEIKKPSVCSKQTKKMGTKLNKILKEVKCFEFTLH